MQQIFHVTLKLDFAEITCPTICLKNSIMESLQKTAWLRSICGEGENVAGRNVLRKIMDDIENFKIDYLYQDCSDDDRNNRQLLSIGKVWKQHTRLLVFEKLRFFKTSKNSKLYLNEKNRDVILTLIWRQIIIITFISWEVKQIFSVEL
eukprot:TRINITY_DN8173_c0_g1_i1.p2 TRINITY_DN8173_c0_g1~~TRINITY_DN8173_c0_g1_i1.p2  ORF type:complete len:149 (-),score=8.68 TRINITY_DN8173_c0_g1_i1:166-612(-)